MMKLLKNPILTGVFCLLICFWANSNVFAQSNQTKQKENKTQCTEEHHTPQAKTQGFHIRGVEMMMALPNVQSVIATETHEDGYEVKTLSQQFVNALPARTQQLVQQSKYYKIEQ